MNKNKELLERRKKAIPRGIGSIVFDKFITEANNDIITDENGKRYIDFASGIAVNNTGHTNPRVNEVVKKQIDKFVHSSFQVMPYEPYIEVCEKINEIAPVHDKDKKTILFNSGAEAVENAIKIAKSQQNREAIVSFVGGFHGRTTLSMSVTGKIKPYKEDFGMPYPYAYHIPFPIDFHNISIEDSKKSLEFLFKSTIHPEKVAAILVEPIMGEGGFYILPKDFAIYLREICDKYNIMLIFDEVQTGFARTGKMFATEYFDVKPDMITMAKGIAGGYILSAVVGKSEIMDKPSVGSLGGTYAGSPVSCVASLEVMKIIEEEGLAQRSYELGVLIREKLNEIKSDFIVNIRGLGCMNAFEFVDKNKQPDSSRVGTFISECKENGLIVLSCGLFGNSIRILNPLTIKKENLFKGLAIMKDIIEKFE